MIHIRQMNQLEEGQRANDVGITSSLRAFLWQKMVCWARAVAVVRKKRWRILDLFGEYLLRDSTWGLRKGDKSRMMSICLPHNLWMLELLYIWIWWQRIQSIIVIQNFVFGGYTIDIGVKPRICSVLGSLLSSKTFFWPRMALGIKPQILAMISKPQCFEKSCEELLACIKMDLNNLVMSTRLASLEWWCLKTDWRGLVETMVEDRLEETSGDSGRSLAVIGKRETE